ncbi:CLUMA_CG013176, isoform A [Clunio marinus]|uniref:CLUMA_CG013176, isoform A n=1 Tax=Clunio marinus TaxID=568069 RepID=A0A1J1IJD5_9DIPT|nr:CLUMA_CG013176, isoform A [Clunio marinus]
MESSLELLSRAALNVQEHEAAMELSKLPAKKKLLSQLKHQQQQNAIQNQAPPSQSSISIIPVNQAHLTSNSSNSKDPEPMEQDDEEDINVHDDDSPLDMRITKHDSDSDTVRPSVIRRAPSFKETSNSPIRDPTSTCDPFIDEHFRRSLGTDYDLIMRNKMEQKQLALQQQQQQQRLIDEQIMNQQKLQQLAAIQAQQQQQNTIKLTHHKKHQIHQHHQAMLAEKHSQAIATPPTTPSPPIIAQLPTPTVSVPPPQPQKQVIITEPDDSDEMSVDDHFAKALGDKWKQIQNEGK